MRSRNWIIFTVVVLLVVSIYARSFAEPKFDLGANLRVAHEFWKNYTDLSTVSKDNDNLFKVKTSLWAKADFNQDNSLYAKLSNENYAHTYFGGGSPAFVDKHPDKKGYHYDINEAFFENFYLDLNNFMGAPVDLRIGRHDLAGQYGEGFLLMDGTPSDGPRSVYFNAAKASWRVDEENTIDVLYINDPRTDQFLPVINRLKLRHFITGYKTEQYLNRNDEEGYVLYWKNKAVKDLYLEGYYIFKRESEEGGLGAYTGEKTKLSTMGSYVRYAFAPYTIRAQAAGQWGSYGDEDRTGLGGYIYLDRDIPEIKTWSPQASLGWLYLSGDDRKTNKQEGWDPLFSRWPWKVSELYVFTIAGETSVCAYWTNIQGFNAELTFKPVGKSKVTLGYLHLMAVETVPNTAGAMFSGNSKERGEVFRSLFEYNLNKNTNLAFQFEYLWPGRFYANRDDALFLRSTLELRF